MDSSGAHTLLLTPRVLLNEQAMREFCEEMDIPRDQIGLIDGNVRGKAREAALQKPYLISTYQSLPALVEAEGDDYRLREELGHRNLILLDEAHTAQGPQTAAILNSLKRQAILGGVTATEAGVSHTLFDGQAPIFNLNLVQAIDDGLLARGVRTGVIDVRIDEDWVDAMLNTPLGKEYSRADLERFSQAPGALKAMAQFHLSYADDELGRIDRFPTLVFTQGVKAAQDGAELFNRMAEAAGSPARAGYVSGDMDATQRDAALSAFASGRIKVLFNDKMLEMGYDLPEATVAYSLKPTQYRHTAEQQLGRITRRQPGDYSDKYGMDKVALAINVRPTGTTPFLFGEVLGNRPARYAHDWEPRYDKERGAGGTANPLLGADVDIHMQYDDLDRIIAGAPRQDQAQEKPEWMLGAVETAKAISVNPPRFANIFQQLSAKGEAARQPGQSEVTVELDGKPVTLGWYKSHTHTTWFIHEASLPVLASHFGKEGKALTGSFAEREQARNGARDNTAQAEPTSWVSRVSGSKNDIDGDDKSGHNR